MHLKTLALHRSALTAASILSGLQKAFHAVRVQILSRSTEICLERLTFIGCALYSGNTHTHTHTHRWLSHCSFIIVCLWPCDPTGLIYAQVLSAQSQPQSADLQHCQKAVTSAALSVMPHIAQTYVCVCVYYDNDDNVNQ